MPGSVQNAAPVAVMPRFLASQFTHSREVWVQQNFYRDGERQTGLLANTSRKRFNATFIGPASELTAMREFYMARKAGTEPFWFYYLPETGYVYDPSGISSTGRYAVVFANTWEQMVGIARSQVQIQLLEVN
jgi:hypothetical protein